MLATMKRHALTTLGCIIVLATISAIGAASFAIAQSVQRPTITVAVHGGGFHWGDAAIGGVVVAGVVIVAAGLVLATGRPQSQHTEWSSHD
jgi:hypothetical protein